MNLSTKLRLVPGCAAIVLLGFTAFATAQVTSEQQSAIRGSCRSDFQAKCSGVTPGGKDALACLQKNVAGLSAACKTAVNATMPATRPGSTRAGRPAAGGYRRTRARSGCPAGASARRQARHRQRAATGRRQAKGGRRAEKARASRRRGRAACRRARRHAHAETSRSDQVHLPQGFRDLLQRRAAGRARGPGLPATQQREAPAGLQNLARRCRRCGAAAIAGRPRANDPHAERPNRHDRHYRSCARDLILYCRDIKVGDGQKIACLMERGPKLSILCKAALKITDPIR